MMTDNLDTLGLKEPVSITGLLSRLGIEPTKNFGKESFYNNVFNGSNSKTKNSLRINSELDAWFDKDLGMGGDIVDFGLAYWQSLNRLEVIKRISEVFNMAITQNVTKPLTGRKRAAIKIPHYHVQHTKPIGENYHISSYLRAKGLLGMDNSYLKEVYYYVVDQKGTRKNFCSAGWKNENGGWEVRSWYYSGCIGPRGMTFIAGEQNAVLVFLEMTHYLSALAKDKISGPNILVLNSTDFFKPAVHRASKFDEVSVFLSSDQLNAHFMTEMEELSSKKINKHYSLCQNI